MDAEVFPTSPSNHGAEEMAEVLRWESDGGPVCVEVEENVESGYQSVRRREAKTIDVPGRFEEALAGAKRAAVSAMRSFQDKALDPHDIEIEFGVKLNAEAGALIAKTAAEGHLIIKLKWSRTDTAAE